MNKKKIYDKYKSIEAQKELCKKKGSPHFAPVLGRCFRCHQNIYEQHTRTEIFLGEEREVVTGITVEEAGSEVITGCPHCNYSYVG